MNSKFYKIGTIILSVGVFALLFLIIQGGIKNNNTRKELKVVNSHNYDYVEEKHEIDHYEYTYQIKNGEIVNFEIKEVRE